MRQFHFGRQSDGGTENGLEHVHHYRGCNDRTDATTRTATTTDSDSDTSTASDDGTTQDTASTNPSCDYRASLTGAIEKVTLGSCLEYVKASEQLDETKLGGAKSSCETGSANNPAGVWQESEGCPTSDVFATCSYVIHGVDIVASYYAASVYYTPEKAKQGCDELSGTYTTL